MAVDVETLVVRLEAKISDFERSMARAQRSANTASARIGSTFSKLNKTIGSGLALVGIGLGVRALTGFITETIKAGEAIGDTAQKLGISAEAFQELAFAADQSGTSMEAIQKGITQTAKFLGEVSRGSKDATLELKNLGLSLDDLKGKSPDQVFELLLDRIGKISDPLKRNAELLKVFGKTGVELGQLASLGAKGIDELRAAAQRLGLVISDETISKMQDAGDKIGVIQAAAKVAGANMTAEFLPAIDALAKLVTSPEFQAGLTNLAAFFGNIVKFLADHPDVIQALALAVGAAKFFGSGVGAAVGLGSMLLPSPAGPAVETIINDQGQRVPISTMKPGQGTTLRPPESPFTQNFDPSQDMALAAALAAKVAKMNAEAASSAAVLTSATEAQRKKFEELAAALQLETDNLQKSTREQFIANEVAKLGAEATQAQIDAITLAAAKYFDLAEAVKKTTERMDLLRDVSRDALSTFINDLREGKSAAEALGDVLNNIANKLLDLATNQLISSLFGAGGTAGGGLIGALFGGARQHGGPVTAGKGFLVGEKGPELFVPNVSGRIVPSGGNAERHTVELVLSEEIDARIKRVSGPQSERISFNIVRANNALTARSRELQG